MTDDGTVPTEREEGGKSACPEKNDVTASDATDEQPTGGNVAKPRGYHKTDGLSARMKRHKKIAALIFTVITIIGTVIGVIVDAPKLFSSETEVPLLHGLDPGKACEALGQAELRCERSDFEATSEVNVVHEQDPQPGAVVSKDTTVRYTYESTAPLPLRRYQASTPDRANFISPTQPGPIGWSKRSSLGRVLYMRQEKTACRDSFQSTSIDARPLTANLRTSCHLIYPCHRRRPGRGISCTNTRHSVASTQAPHHPEHCPCNN